MMDEQTREKVRQVGEILRSRDSRCRVYWALPSEYNEDGPTDFVGTEPEACRFCIRGAIHRVAGTDAGLKMRHLAEVIEDYLIPKDTSVGLISFWDDATDEEQDAIVEKLLNA